MNGPHLAAAVVVHRGCVLIVRRSERETFLPRQWGVPCGKVGAGEDPRDAVLRELHEETGLAGTVAGYAGRSDFPSVWHGQPVINVQRNYLVHATAGGAGMPGTVLPERDQETRWVAGAVPG